MINIGVGPGSLSQLLDTITIAGQTLNFKLSCNGKLSGIIIARATLHYHKHYPTIFALSKTTQEESFFAVCKFPFVTWKMGPVK